MMLSCFLFNDSFFLFCSNYFLLLPRHVLLLLIWTCITPQALTPQRADNGPCYFLLYSHSWINPSNFQNMLCSADVIKAPSVCVRGAGLGLTSSSHPKIPHWGFYAQLEPKEQRIWITVFRSSMSGSLSGTRPQFLLRSAVSNVIMHRVSQHQDGVVLSCCCHATQ